MFLNIIIALLLTTGCSIKDTDFYKDTQKNIRLSIKNQDQYKDVNKLTKPNLRWSKYDQYDIKPNIIKKNITQF